MTQTRTQPFVPKYQQLFEYYKEQILKHTLKPGQRIDSINELMQRHDVSRETAKTVLKNLADHGYVIQRAGKGSFVNKFPTRKKTWGLILPLYSIQYEELFQYIAHKATGMKRKVKHFVDYNNWKEEIRLVGQMIMQGYEAIIVVPTLDETKTASFYRRLSKHTTIVTLLDHTMTGSYFSYVIQNYNLGLLRGMRYLLQHSRGTIAFVRNEIWAERDMLQESLEVVYKEILTKERPEAPPVVIKQLDHINAETLHKHNITGILCMDDASAIRVMGKLSNENVRIPDDIRLISYGNTDLARYFTPGITSIDPHNAEMAEKIVSIIDRRLKGENTDFCQYVVQPEVVERET
ncbi:MAG: GntR family transcriptional regulator [Chitinivibrionales bacterium]|nr:GntR family transcriptional regulator [Chitinivibrionales bacterium]